MLLARFLAVLLLLLVFAVFMRLSFNSISDVCPFTVVIYVLFRRLSFFTRTFFVVNIMRS